MQTVKVQIQNQPQKIVNVRLVSPLQKGDNGARLELRYNSQFPNEGIEQKYENQSTWTLLIPRSELVPQINISDLIPIIQSV